MAAFFNGEIHSIKQEIIQDIETLLEFVERWNKNDAELDAANAAARVSAYIHTYQAVEEEEPEDAV